MSGISIKEIVQGLKDHPTYTEALFWEQIKNKKAEGSKFVRQYPIRFEYGDTKYFFIADFYCSEYKLIINIEGKIHQEQDPEMRDNIRTLLSEKLGYHVFEIKDKERVSIDIPKTLTELKQILRELQSKSGSAQETKESPPATPNSNQSSASQSRFALKSLGQNFLNSTIIRDNIITAAGDIENKKVLEIGPGLGFLTEALLNKKCDLTAVELDERAIEILNKKFGDKKHFCLIPGSILDQNLDILFDQEIYSVVANIPYHITNPIIRKLFAETKNKPEVAILMVQKEVANKICRTKPGKEKITDTRSILSISVEIYATAENLFEVKREHFDPSPKVDSAIIKLTKRDKPLVSKDLERDFFTVVNAGFSERRKKLKNVLTNFFRISAEKLLGDIDGELRGETLEIEDWIQIAQNFQSIKNQL